MTAEKAVAWATLASLVVQVAEGALRIKDRRSRIDALEKRLDALEAKQKEAP